MCVIGDRLTTGMVAVKDPALVMLALSAAGGSAGLKTFASLQSTRQLSEHTSAGLGLTWQPRVGAGLQLSSTRQLSDTTSADFTWVVGPRAAQGAGLSISRRGERLTTSAGLNVSPLAEEQTPESVLASAYCRESPAFIKRQCPGTQLGMRRPSGRISL